MASNLTVPALKLEPDADLVRQVREDLKDVRNGVRRAVAPAINKTLAKGQTTLIEGLARILTAKRGNILGKKDNRRIRVEKASAAKLSGKIRILQRPIGLVNFQVKDTRGRRVKKGWNKKGSGRGVVAQVRRNEAPVVLPKAFIALGLSDNRHVFERFGVKRKQGKARHKPNIGKMRQPIRSFKGESLHAVWRDTPSLRAAVQGRIYDEFPKDVLSQVDRILARSKSARGK